MTNSRLIYASGCIILLFCRALTNGVPLEEREATPPPANSLACMTVYHGQCIDTLSFQCNGISIPGLCGNLTHYSFMNSDETPMQCCNGWSIVPISGGV